MTQYNSLNVKLPSSQLNKLKAAIKKTKLVLKLPSNVIHDSDDETNFPQKLSMTDRQVTNLLLTNHRLISSNQKSNYLR